ncbi:MAG: hypothetical protein JWO62_2325 [Acidimicrobiaceae bacterium]|nr:hypothetical protein [Acidimicrobiaceae bacterium]
MSRIIRLSRHSERFAASGGIGALTTRRALGAHSLPFWELFLRETLQNSWDARLTSSGPITFAVDAWTATTAQRTYLRDFVLTDPPPLLGLEGVLEDPNLSVLVVSDTGTWGLSGPTRADADPASAPGGRSHFVDLVRDIGRRANKGYAGGTYGFGKAVLCEASAVSAVVIYTRTLMNGTEHSRFIAMAIGDDEYSERGVRYTGRHWWGNVVRGQLAEPLLGPDAEYAALNLGIHNAIKDKTGTVIMVVAPRSPEASSSEGLEQITEAIAKAASEYTWPHVLPGQPESIKLRVTHNGIPVQVLTASTDPRLRAFAEAFIRCEQLAQGNLDAGDAWPWYHRKITSGKPVANLGTLAWRHWGTPGSSVAGGEPSSQIALIRNPHFVVTYRDAPTDPAGRNIAGAFLAAPELDGMYAASEPPTHDAWIPAKGVRFDPARQVLRKISEEVRGRPKEDRSRSAGEDAPGVVSIASALGILLDGETAIGDSRIPWGPPRLGRSEHERADDSGPTASANTSWAASNGRDQSSGKPTGMPAPAADVVGVPTGAGGTATPGTPDIPPSESVADPNVPQSRRRYLRVPTVRLSGEPGLLMFDGAVAAEFPFTLSVMNGINSVTLSGGPSVFIDGGRETEAPLGAAMPRVLAWRDLSTDNIFPGPELTLAQPTSAKWSVIVSQLSDAAVGVDISVVSYE